MTTCPQCATENEPEAAQCRVCGLTLGQAERDLPPPPGSEPPLLPEVPPTKRRGIRVVPLVIAATAIAGGLVFWAIASVLRSPTIETYDAHGITFDAPDWSYDEGADGVTGLDLDEMAWSDAFLHGPRTMILVGAIDEEPPSVTSEEVEAEAAAFVEAFANGADLPEIPDHRVTQVDGKPAIVMDGPVMVDGSVMQRVVAIFGDTFYLIKCQYAEEDEAETLTACDRILNTLAL